MYIKLANGTNILLQYEQFKVTSANNKYKLTVGGFQGTTNDAMINHNEMNFTTKDCDSDIASNTNCAVGYRIDQPIAIGRWWFGIGCCLISLNISL